MSILFTYPKFQAIDSTGAPLSGGLLHTYAVGTTTDKATYSDRALTTANANPVVLDTRGEATVYLDSGGYKFLLETSLGVEVWSFDNYYGPGQLDNIITSLGDIIQGGTSGVPERLGIGTEDQIVTVGGDGKLIYKAGSVSSVRLTNNSGAILNANDVVIVDTSADTAAALTTTEGLTKPVFIVSEGIAIGAEGLFYNIGKATVAVSGNVARGDYLFTSTTSGEAASAGSLLDRNGIFGQALTAYTDGGSGTVTALLFGKTISGFTVGEITAHGGSTAPTTERKLLCNGDAYNRTTYADLYAILGTAFGVGDGSTTFNLPDLRQRFPLGKAAAGTGSTLGGTGGEIDHTHDLTYTATTMIGGAPAVGYVPNTTTDTQNPPFQVVNYLIRY